MTFALIWTYMKKHWLRFLEAAAVLVAFFFGLSVKKRPVLVTGDSPVQKKAEETAAAQDLTAQKQREATKEDLTKHHDEDVHAVVVTLEKKTAALELDPQATNDYLHDVGKRVRGDK